MFQEGTTRTEDDMETIETTWKFQIYHLSCNVYERKCRRDNSDQFVKTLWKGFITTAGSCECCVSLSSFLSFPISNHNNNHKALHMSLTSPHRHIIISDREQQQKWPTKQRIGIAVLIRVSHFYIHRQWMSRDCWYFFWNYWNTQE